MSEPVLFEMEPIELPVLASADPSLSYGQRLTLRQSEAIARGDHPLSIVAVGLRLHPEASTERDGGGPRCGTCAHRYVGKHHDYTYPKCDLHESHGAATDCRAWWPACGQYQPREANA